MARHLPLNDHTARYCPGSKLTEDGCPAPTAFHLRRGETYLSVEWLEALNQESRNEAITDVIAVLSDKLRLGASARLAVLNVGQVCRHVREASMYSLRFLHEPEPDDPVHSGIHDTAQDEMLIAELIAEKVEGLYPVKYKQGGPRQRGPGVPGFGNLSSSEREPKKKKNISRRNCSITPGMSSFFYLCWD